MCFSYEPGVCKAVDAFVGVRLFRALQTQIDAQQQTLELQQEALASQQEVLRMQQEKLRKQDELLLAQGAQLERLQTE